MRRALLLLALAAVGCGEPQNWRDLRQHLSSIAPDQRAAAVERFITAKGGSPIVENQTRLVFFAKDKDRRPPRIVGDFNAWASTPQGYDLAIGRTTRIEGTEWSYLESTAYSNARLEYVLFYEGEAAADPLNPRQVQAYAGPRSEVRMPFWVPQPEVDATGDAPSGQLIAETISSRSLGGPRRVWFYLPPGYATERDVLFPVIYILDGGNYVETMDVPRVLDRLVGARAVPPVIAVFAEPADRREEYSRNPRWRAFITGELVPMVDKRFRTFSAPDHRIILGSSLSAYGAVDLAVEHPSVFGLCAALAPPAQTATVVANQATARTAVVSIKFFVMGGVYDEMIGGARTLRTTLDDYDAPVTYLEVSEGHNTNTFRAHLDDVLRALLNQ